MDLSNLTAEQHDRFLDAVKAGLKSEGRKEVSVYLLTHKKEAAAKCCACDVWFAISELKQSDGCPKCGSRGDFDVDVTEEEIREGLKELEDNQ